MTLQCQVGVPRCGVQSRVLHRLMPVLWDPCWACCHHSYITYICDKSLFLMSMSSNIFGEDNGAAAVTVLVLHKGSGSWHARLSHLPCSSLSGCWQGAQTHLHLVLLTRLCHILGPWVMVTLTSEKFLPSVRGLLAFCKFLPFCPAPQQKPLTPSAAKTAGQRPLSTLHFTATATELGSKRHSQHHTGSR